MNTHIGRYCENCERYVEEDISYLLLMKEGFKCPTCGEVFHDKEELLYEVVSELFETVSNLEYQK